METVTFNSVQDFNDYYGFETQHPLVSVVRNTKPANFTARTVHYGIYALFLKENKGCELSYGRTKYDFNEMTVTSFAPGQTINVKPMPGVTTPIWTALVFHPDFLARTPLGRNILRYEFFSYSSSEALHLSVEEISIFRIVLDMISRELHHAIDKHTRELIVSNIELLLNYCLRFYDRQFVTREEINHTVIQKFNTLLTEYIEKTSHTRRFANSGLLCRQMLLVERLFRRIGESGNRTNRQRLYFRPPNGCREATARR